MKENVFVLGEHRSIANQFLSELRDAAQQKDRMRFRRIDPMLATGRSVLDAHKLLPAKGTPSHLYIVSVVAAPEGMRLLNENISLPYSLWTCAVDEKLNASSYIVPGLGDAGDLSFGTKL